MKFTVPLDDTEQNLIRWHRTPFNPTRQYYKNRKNEFDV